MEMREYALYANVQQVARSTGRSSVEAAAYRSASRLYDERTGEVYDYTKKPNVEHTQLYVPEWVKGSDIFAIRSKIWNEVERREYKSNATTAHEIIMAFPAEFKKEHRLEMGKVLADELIRRYEVVVDIGYHRPPKGGDDRNYYAHVMFTTRSFDETTKDGWAKNKFRELSKDPIWTDPDKGKPTKYRRCKTITHGMVEIHDLRHFIAGEMNTIARREGMDVHTEHLSFAERGIDCQSSQHLGPHAFQMEKRGVRSRIGDANNKNIIFGATQSPDLIKRVLVSKGKA
ncbi:MAG: MobA/MobL family protein [Bacteroidetes bacterium]|nr:MobA/MobL family protein [Bacteroidota bacterium]